jgi:hypothetical protein
MNLEQIMQIQTTQIINKNYKILKILAAIFIPIIILSGFVFLFFVDPEKNSLFPCFFRFATGLDCPGCGTTRALYSLLHLRFWQAFRYNPLIYLLVPFTTYFGIIGYIYLLTGKFFKINVHIPKLVVWSLIVLFLAFVILRNIPIEPFSYFKV